MLLGAGNLQLREAMVELYLLDDGLNHDIYLRALGVVGRTNVVYAVVADKVVKHCTLPLLLGVIHSDGVASEVLDQLHTGNICRSITEIYHTPKWYRTLRLLHKAVDILGVEYRLYALVYFEDKLCLVSIVYRHCWPIGYAVDVVEERAGVDILKLVSYGSSLDNLLKARGVDVV